MGGLRGGAARNSPHRQRNRNPPMSSSHARKITTGERRRSRRTSVAHRRCDNPRMANTLNPMAAGAPDDLVTQATPRIEAPPGEERKDAEPPAEERRDAEAPSHSTGILPSHELERQIRVTKEIFALEPIDDGQIQP